MEFDENDDWESVVDWEESEEDSTSFETAQIQDLFDLLESGFDELGWRRQFCKKTNAYFGSLNVQGNLGFVYVRLSVDEGGVCCLAVPRLKIVKERRREVAQFLERVNDELAFASFAFDMSDGRICYCEDWTTSDFFNDPFETVAEVFARPRRTFGKYGTSLLTVAFGFASAREAFEKMNDDE